uniref:Alpha-type protein kinase domain-containing protein n=1 Tax=Callorhinchus milii TaxID=7868 RepID=A0A4W3HFX0_CALMI
MSRFYFIYVRLVHPVVDKAEIQPLLLEAGERCFPENTISSMSKVDDHGNCRTCDDKQTPDPDIISLSQQEDCSCQSDSTRLETKCEMQTNVLFTKSMTSESSDFKDKGVEHKPDELLLLSLSGERDELDPALGVTECRSFSPVTQPTNFLNTLHDRTVQSLEGLEEKVCEEHKDTQASVQCMGADAGTANVSSPNRSETLSFRASALTPVWHLDKEQSVVEHRLAEPVLLSVSDERDELDLALDVMENRTFSPVTESTVASAQSVDSLLITITDDKVMAREEMIDRNAGENETESINQKDTSISEYQGPYTVQDVITGDHQVCAINEKVGEQSAYPTEISKSPVKDGGCVGEKGEFGQNIASSIREGDDLTCMSAQPQGSEADCGMESGHMADLLMPLITADCDLEMEIPCDNLSIRDIDMEPFRPWVELHLQNTDPSSVHHKGSESNVSKAEDQYGRVDILRDSQTSVAMSVHISNVADTCSTIGLTDSQCLDEELKSSLDVYNDNAAGLKNNKANLPVTKSSQVESSPIVACGRKIVPIVPLSHSSVGLVEGFTPMPVPQISAVHKVITSELEKSAYGLQNITENILLNTTAEEHDQTVQPLEGLQENVCEEHKDTQASVQSMGSQTGTANVTFPNSSKALSFPTTLVPPVLHLDKQQSVAEHKLAEPVLLSVSGERDELDLALGVMGNRTFTPVIEAAVADAQPVDSILIVDCEVMAREKVSLSKMTNCNSGENETERVNQEDTSTTECQGRCTVQDVINGDHHTCAINEQLGEQSTYPTVLSMSPVTCPPFINAKPNIQTISGQVLNSEPVLDLEDNFQTLQNLGEPDIKVDTSGSPMPSLTKMNKSDGSLLATAQLQPALVSNTSDNAMSIMEFIVANKQESSTACFAIIETSVHPQMIHECAVEKATKVVLVEDHERVQFEHDILPTDPESLEPLFVKVSNRNKMDIIQPMLQDQVHSVIPVTEILGATELIAAVNCKCSEESSPRTDQFVLLQGEAGQFTKDSGISVTPSAEDKHTSDQSQSGKEESGNVSASLKLGTPPVRLKSLIVRSVALDVNNISQKLGHRGNWTGSEEHSSLNAGQVAGQLRTKTEPGKSCSGNKPVSITGENTDTNDGKSHELPNVLRSPEPDTIPHPVVNSVTKAEPEMQMELGKGFPRGDLNKSSAPAALSCFPSDVNARTSRQNADAERKETVCQTLEPPSNKTSILLAQLDVTNVAQRNKDHTELLCAQQASKISVQDGQRKAIGTVSSIPSKPLAKGNVAFVPYITKILGATELTATMNSMSSEGSSPCVDHASALFQGEAGQLTKGSETSVALSAEDGDASDQSQGGTEESANVSAGLRLGAPQLNEQLKSLMVRSAASSVNISFQTLGSQGDCKSGSVEHSALDAGQVAGQLQPKTEPGKSCSGNKPASITGENTETNKGKNHDLPTALKSPESETVAHLIVHSVTNSDTIEPEIQMELGKGFPGGDLNKSSTPVVFHCFPSDSKMTKANAERKEAICDTQKPPNKLKLSGRRNKDNDCQRDKDGIELPHAQKVSKVLVKDRQRSIVGSVSSTPSKPLAKESLAFVPCISENLGATELTATMNSRFSEKSSTCVDQSALFRGEASQLKKDLGTTVTLSAESANTSVQSQGGTEESANVSASLRLGAPPVSERLKSLIVRSAALDVNNSSQTLGYRGIWTGSGEHSALNAGQVAGRLRAKTEPGKSCSGNKSISVTGENTETTEGKNHDLPNILRSPEPDTIPHPIVNSVTKADTIEPEMQVELGKGFPRGDLNKSSAPAALSCFPPEFKARTSRQNTDAERKQMVCQTMNPSSNKTSIFPAQLNVANVSQRNKDYTELLCAQKVSKISVQDGQRKAVGTVSSIPSKPLAKGHIAFAPCVTEILGATELTATMNSKCSEKSSPCVDHASALFQGEAGQLTKGSGTIVALSAEDEDTSDQSQGGTEESANVRLGAPPVSERLKSLMVRSAVSGVNNSSQTLQTRSNCKTVAGEHSALNAGQVAGKLQPKTKPGKSCRGNKPASTTRESTETNKGKNHDLSTDLKSPKSDTFTHQIVHSVTNTDTIEPEIHMKLGKGFPVVNLNKSSAPDILDYLPSDSKVTNTDAERKETVCKTPKPPNNKTPKFSAQLNVENDTQRNKDSIELLANQKVSKVSVQEGQSGVDGSVSSMLSKPFAKGSIAFVPCITEILRATELTTAVNCKNAEASSPLVYQSDLFQGEADQLTKDSGISVTLSAEDDHTSVQSQGETEESANVSVGLRLDVPPISERLHSLMVRSAALGVDNSSQRLGHRGVCKMVAGEHSVLNAGQVAGRLWPKTEPGKSCRGNKTVSVTGEKTQTNENYDLPNALKSLESDPVAHPVVHSVTNTNTIEPEIQIELGKQIPERDINKSSPPASMPYFTQAFKTTTTDTEHKKTVCQTLKQSDNKTPKFYAQLNAENALRLTGCERDKDHVELPCAQKVSKFSLKDRQRRVVGSVSSMPSKPLAKGSVAFVPCITEILGATELTATMNSKCPEESSPRVDKSALLQGEASQLTKDLGSPPSCVISAGDNHTLDQSLGETEESVNVSTSLRPGTPPGSERLKNLKSRLAALGVGNSSQTLGCRGGCKTVSVEPSAMNAGYVAGRLRPKTEPKKTCRGNVPASVTRENNKINEDKNHDLFNALKSPESDTVAHQVVHMVTNANTIEPEMQMELGKEFPTGVLNKSGAPDALRCFPLGFKARTSRQNKEAECKKMVCQTQKLPSNKTPKLPARLNMKNDSQEHERDKDGNELPGAPKVSKVSVQDGQGSIVGSVSSTEILGASELTAAVNSQRSEESSPRVDQSALFQGEVGQLTRVSECLPSVSLSTEDGHASDQSEGGTEESTNVSAGLRLGPPPVSERLKSLKLRSAASGVDNSSQILQNRGDSALNADQEAGRLQLKTEPGKSCRGTKPVSVTGENAETNEGKNHDLPNALKRPESDTVAHSVVHSVTNSDTIEPEIQMEIDKGFPKGNLNKSSAPAGLYCFPPDLKAISKDIECKKMVCQSLKPPSNKIPKFPAQLNPENDSWEYERDKDIIELPHAQTVSKVSVQDEQRSAVGSASPLPSKSLAQGNVAFVPFHCMTTAVVKLPLAAATTKELMLGARKKVHLLKPPSEISGAAPEPVSLVVKVDDHPKKEAVKRLCLSPVRQGTVLSETCSSAEKENFTEDITATKRICQKAGEEATQHNDYQELRKALQPQQEVQKGGEEIELLQLTVEKELTTQCNFGGQMWGRIATDKVHFGEGLHRKAFRTTVICGLLPLFDSGHSCVLKIHNTIAYGTKSNNDLIELNYKLAVQECQVQNTAREYACGFAAEGMLLDNFGDGPEVIPIYLIHRTANIIPYATVEEELIGDFVKYSVRDGRELNVGRKVSEAGQKCCTFQHWVYQRTDGNLLVTDMQGVGMKLTDIGIATCSKGYKGFKGNCYISFIEQFKALHQCNQYCNMMGLKSLKTSQQKPKRTGSVKTHLTHNQSRTQQRKYR